MALPFGSGFFIMNPGPEAIELQFEGVEGQLPAQAAPRGEAAFVTVACTGTEAAAVPDLLGFPLLEGDTAYVYDGGQWSISVFQDGSWSDFVPQLQPGEAMFMKLVPRP
jgi:hypothetical protein